MLALDAHDGGQRGESLVITRTWQRRQESSESLMWNWYPSVVLAKGAGGGNAFCRRSSTSGVRYLG